MVEDVAVGRRYLGVDIEDALTLAEGTEI